MIQKKKLDPQPQLFGILQAYPSLNSRILWDLRTLRSFAVGIRHSLAPTPSGTPVLAHKETIVFREVKAQPGKGTAMVKSLGPVVIPGD